MDSNPLPKDLLQSLMARASSLWGEERAKALRPAIEANARQLLEIGRNLPSTKTEPGVHPTLN